MENKDLLLKSIDAYNIYTDNQKKLLKALIELAVDDLVIANIVDLNDITEVSRPSIYRALERFSDDGFIEINQTSGIKLTSLKIKRTNLNKIIDHFTKKDNLMKNK